jgi:hypothetical protein
MTVKAILDTDILSEYLKGHNAAVAGRAAGYAKEGSLQPAKEGNGLAEAQRRDYAGRR